MVSWGVGRSLVERVNFDQFAEEYDQIHNQSITLAGEESAFFTELKIRLLADYFRNNTPRHVLDYGCGTGRAATFLHRYFPNITYTGCDLSEQSIHQAQLQNPHDSFFTVGKEPITHHTQKYDLIIAAVVFHHIPLTERHATLENLHASLSEGGYLVLFEHNPHNPLTRKVVRDCPFDKDAVLLTPRHAKTILQNAGFTIEHLQYYFFYPKFLSFMRPTEKIFRKFPLGAQYMLVAKKEQSNKNE